MEQTNVSTLIDACVFICICVDISRQEHMARLQLSVDEYVHADFPPVLPMMPVILEMALGLPLRDG